MTTYDNSSIHRYLDGAFAPVPASPEAQDLKEEIRGNLAARVAELEASGLDGSAATRKAIKELGDIREVLAPLGASGPDSGGGVARDLKSTAAAYARNKVRPKPAFVVRTVLLSLTAAAGLALVALCATDVVSMGVAAPAILAVAAVALPAWLLTADGLRQETSSNYPLPRRRAVSYGVASALGAEGLALGAIYWGDHGSVWPLFVFIALTVSSILVFTYLGVTQTNRKKRWVRELGDAWMEEHQGHQGADRFSEDPVAAARFGIYSGALWIVAIGAFIALWILYGFTWSWLALFGALVVEMLLLARMLFPAGPRRT